ncbi:hypothetical protein [Alkalinema sp. FACHB-956]|uniref:hypothetical protein n=1 Tax=Alkalinema sp. FACHB-956 TaxID=2692768 RepID=UPI00168A0EF6|nr:hypothetical protein [Alkalinema sp. FACHB-956]MBD2326794.1 hypothetical protein [Alkalinema sp. FACHB-956]
MNATKRNSGMKPEIVKDFLNVPGILGIALLDRQSPLYFCGIETPFHLQQTTVLEQGLRQILATMPDSIKEFELQFQTYRIHIYRFVNTATVLILTQPQLKPVHYQGVLDPLLGWVQTSREGAIAQFREITEQILPPAQPASVASVVSSDAGLPRVIPEVILPEAILPEAILPTRAVSSQPSLPAPSNAVVTPRPDVSQKPQSAPPTVQGAIRLQEQIEAFNELSQIATQYLGNAIIANHLSRSRPDVPWLQQFSIDRTAHLSFNGDAKQVVQPMSEAEINDMQQWAKAFINQCSRVIRDFPLLVKQQSSGGYAQSRLLT